MTKTNQLLFAATVLPAVALWLPTPLLAAQADAPIIVAQQQQDPNAPHPKDTRQPPPGQRPQQPAPKPTVQQPPPAPSRPTVQQPPAASPHPSVQEQHQVAPPPRPTVQQPPPAPPHPSVQEQHQVAPPPRPTVQQPPASPHPSAQEHQVAPPPKPTVQQPIAPQRPVVQQPAIQQPPPAAHVPPAPPPAPAAQQPPLIQQPPTAQQPATPPPPAASHRPDQMQRPVTQQPVVPQQVPTAQSPVQPMPRLEVARDRQQILEHQQRADEWRNRRVQDLHEQRREVVENGRTVIREPDRTIIVENGRPIIRHNEVDRFGFGARGVDVQRRGHETFTIVERPGGVRIVTVVDDEGRMLRRLRRGPDGREVILIDNTVQYGDPDRADAFFLDLAPPVVRIPRERYIVEAEVADPGMIYEALTAPPIERIERRYSLDEVRFNEPLLERMPRVDIDTITFDLGSWTVAPDQVGRLSAIAEAINRAVTRNPQEVFLIEGHTDAVGSDVDNLSLSDRRAETVAAVLTEQFQVPPENMTTQGYGKQYLKIPTDGPERRNRRVTIRRITPLLTGQNGPPAN